MSAKFPGGRGSRTFFSSKSNTHSNERGNRPFGSGWVLLRAWRPSSPCNQDNSNKLKFIITLASLHIKFRQWFHRIFDRQTTEDGRTDGLRGHWYTIYNVAHS